MNSVSSAEDYITSEIREFRQIRKSLTVEEKRSAIDLSQFKGTIYEDEEEYKNAFENKIFKYGRRYYKYRFKFGIRTRYIGENLIMLGIVKIGRSPDITELSVNVISLFCFLFHCRPNLLSSLQSTM